MNTLEAIQIYARVAELASFTAAAEQLGLPRASVSTAVQQLETLLGTRLLHRTTRRVQMTQDGQVFYERSKDVLADIDDLQGLFRAGDDALRGRLRVDMPQAVARDVVLPRLPEFLARHPALEIELSSTDRRVDIVREGFDCVLRVGELSDSSLIARTLGYYAMVNCASPDYLLRHGVPLSLADLATHRLVHYTPVLGARATGFEYLDAQGVPRSVAVPGSVTVNSTAAYEGACLAGLGIIQVPRAGAAAHLEAGRLVELLPAFSAPAMPVSLLYANRRHLPRRVQVFMQWLAELMGSRLEAAAVAPAR
ncbi:MAG: LysR family transcriptional regulator [Candidatus Dactylopiibacterium sp.]|nr:LysR family transcriptional regulator [Candidatus Dactylopiibacterium sp.]